MFWGHPQRTQTDFGCPNYKQPIEQISRSIFVLSSAVQQSLHDLIESFAVSDFYCDAIHIIHLVGTPPYL